MKTENQTSGPSGRALPGQARDEFISKKELAARLMVATRTIERWQHDDLLPYFKVGTVVLFNWPEVVERLKTNFKVGNGGDTRLQGRVE